MPVNSPFGNPAEKPENNSFAANHSTYPAGDQPASSAVYPPAPNLNAAQENSHYDVPQEPLTYGSVPAVQPTGKNSTFSIVGFIFSILIPLVGLILSIMAFKQSKENGDNRGLAKAGIIIGAVLLAFNIISGFIIFGAVAMSIENGTYVTIN